MTHLEKQLKHYFNYDHFRLGQKEAIKAAISGESSLVMLPTGTGKSLCYQLSGYINQSLTLIVSPLISLMMDQVFLLKHDFNYAYIRAGGRGYGKDGNFYTDPNFKMFIDACEYLGMPYGFYYIDEALTSEEVDEEVEFMYDFITKNATSKNILPLVIDIEKYDDNIKARTRDIWEDRKYLATELVDKFLAKGISSIIYTNANIANKYLYEVNTCFWLAYYDQKDKVPNYWYTSLEDQEPIQNEELMNKMIAWQFSESGAGKEIDLNVDLNLVKNDFFIEYVKKYTKDK